MIPMIETLGHIETCFRRRQSYPRWERVQILKACKKQLDVLRTARKITDTQWLRMNGKLLPVLSEEEYRWSQNQYKQPTMTMKPSTPPG